MWSNTFFDSNLDVSVRDSRLRHILDIKSSNKYDDMLEYKSVPGTIHYADVFNTLNRFLGPDDLLVMDAGNNSIWAKYVIRCRYPGQYIAPGGTGAMGWGAPAAVGVQFACPDKQRDHGWR